MKKEQLFGIVRTVAAAGFGYLAGKGLIDGATVDLLAGAVATIGVGQAVGSLGGASLEAARASGNCQGNERGHQ